MPAYEQDIETSTFELLEHPSDFGLRVVSPHFESSLLMIAFGMLRSMYTLDKNRLLRRKTRITKMIEAEDREQSIVRFLQDMIHLVYVDRCMPVRMSLQPIAKHKYECLCTCIELSEDDDIPGAEIKAVTYHQLSIITEKGQCSITVFFDI